MCAPTSFHQIGRYESWIQANLLETKKRTSRQIGNELRLFFGQNGDLKAAAAVARIAVAGHE
jgi:hypothetical protein